MHPQLRSQEEVVGLWIGPVDDTHDLSRRRAMLIGERGLHAIAGDVSAPTFDELYSGEWEHPTCCG